MTEGLRRTPLYRRHVDLGARMVEFGGWEMPVYYTGINEEHRAVRARAGVFDVSHMGEFEITGQAALAFLQSQLSNDLDRIGTGQAQYTLLTTSGGGIVDDLIAYRTDAGFLLVVNAGNTAADLAHLQDALPSRNVKLVDRSTELGMIALQGPAADDVLVAAAPRAKPDELAPFHHRQAEIGGVTCTIARTGYTGERGVEILMPAGGAEAVWDALLAQREHGVVPCGLGARDTLRLEVCYPLHGNDIGPDTDAIAAGLGWACALSKEFTGAAALRRIAEDGPASKLVPFTMIERAIPRAGLDILVGGERVGHVTSGTLSPTLDRGIGMGYVRTDLATPGTGIVVDVRGRLRDAEIARKPLYRKEP
jgi:aminomethyltransferase